MGLAICWNPTMKLNYLSLQQRLLIWLLLPILSIGCFGVYAAYLAVLHFTNVAYDRALEDSVRTLARQIQIDKDGVNINLPDAAIQMLEFDQVDKVYFSVSDIKGHLLIGNYGPLSDSIKHFHPTSVRFYNGVVEDRPVRIAEYDIAGKPGHDSLYVRVAETLNKREIVAREALLLMVTPQFLFLIVTILLVWFGSGYAIAPLNRVQEAISKRTHEDLSPLDTTGMPLEVSEQVRVINDLMSRLGKTLDSQRRFIADATHQLRTPITVLLTQSELALRAQDYVDLRTIVTRINSTTTRLGRLANQLLNLSRAEAGFEGVLDFSFVKIADVIEEVVAGLVPSALSKQIDIRVGIDENLPEIFGDKRLLSDMLANLVDNAIRYTGEGRDIVVSAKEEEEKVVLTVEDSGPGIPEAEMELVLDRFYRGENASSEGSGLGLAIAKEIALLHKGQIKLLQRKDVTGLTVIIKIPAIHSEAIHE